MPYEEAPSAWAAWSLSAWDARKPCMVIFELNYGGQSAPSSLTRASPRYRWHFDQTKPLLDEMKYDMVLFGRLRLMQAR